VRGRAWLFAGVIAVVGARPATADVAPKKPRPPAAAMTLHITPGALGTPWTLEITNVDSMPLRFVSDARLLSLDVRRAPVEGKPPPRAATHCALPSELRPTDDDKARVLLPNVTFVETFDPRLYCFDTHDAAALVPGAEVTARLGWSSTAASPPFIADQIEGGEPRSGVKELLAEPVTVPDELPAPDVGPANAHGLVVSSSARIDSENGRQLAMSVTVENTTSRTVRLMLRPETVSFEVASPRGVRECVWGRGPGAVIAEVLTSIAPHGKASTEVLLTSLCPDGTLDKAGLYTVRAGIDTRHTSGKAIGIETFEGRVGAEKTSLVRIRRDRPQRL
jgi:hypothetical protein